MPDVSDLQRAVGRYVQQIFGERAVARWYGDDDNEYQAAVVHGPDCPAPGVTSYSTVGLSAFYQQAGERSVRVEVVGANRTQGFDLVISSCYFEHVKNSTQIVYGALLRNLLLQYDMSETMRHVTFVAPFLWEGLSKANIENELVYWLMALPISDAEAAILSNNGIDELESLFNEAQIDIYDLNRPSIV